MQNRTVAEPSSFDGIEQCRFAHRVPLGFDDGDLAVDDRAGFRLFKMEDV
jgi:hypothetical protein